jgi:hypothetical protein
MLKRRRIDKQRKSVSDLKPRPIVALRKSASVWKRK